MTEWARRARKINRASAAEKKSLQLGGAENRDTSRDVKGSVKQDDALSECG